MWFSRVFCGLLAAHQVAAGSMARTGKMYQRSTPDSSGAVASENKICSQIGINLMQQGGNAADAMVGTVFCVGAVAPSHSGIGGGGFMLVRSPNGTYEFIDFREKAPAAAFTDMYNSNANLSIFGGLASGVPGEVRGLQYLHEKYGKLPWKTVMQGAVDVARNGFPVTPDGVRYINDGLAAAGMANFLTEDPSWAIDFAPNGTLVKLGDTMSRKRYGDTLATIAEEGPDAFYTGAIARTMIDALQAANGTMTMEDLANYTVAIREVGNITYRGYKVHSCTNPSSGTVALSALNILSNFDGFFAPGTVNESTHYLDEAIRFAYGQRMDMGDPYYVANLTEFQNEILQPAAGARIKAMISPTHALNISAYDPNGFVQPSDGGTSHMVSADASGLAISLTTTINLYFGSQLCVPETGIIMNDEMNDFSIPNASNKYGYVPTPNNYIKPGKRPLSSIAPTIVETPDGQLHFIVGAAGGSRITTATIQNLVNVLDRNMSAYEALATPRLHDQLLPNQTSFEWAYDNSTVAFMASYGYNITWVAPGQAEAQGILRLENGTFQAAGEPRQSDSAGIAF